MEKIGKDEFIRQLQKSLLKDGIELSLDNLDKIVDSVLSIIEDNVVKDNIIEFVGFDKFLPRHHNARSMTFKEMKSKLKPMKHLHLNREIASRKCLENRN